MRILAWVVAASLVGVTAAHAEWGTVVDATALKSGPGAQHQTIATIPSDGEFDFGDCQAGWCRVTWKDQTGYVARDDIYDEDEAIECYIWDDC